MLADHVPQRRAEQRCGALHEVVRTDQGDAERTAHRAARAVGRHHVAGVHGAQRPRAHVAEANAGAVRAREDPAQLGPECDASARCGAQVLEQQRLEVVLRHAGGRRGADHAALLRVRIADGDRRAGGGVGERLGLEHAPVDVDAARADPGLEPPRPHELHRAQAERGGARVRGEQRPALDEQAGNVVSRQLDRGRQPGRAGADHQHGNVVERHGVDGAGGDAWPHEQSLLKSDAGGSDCQHAVAVHGARGRAPARRRSARGWFDERRRDRGPRRRRQDAARGRSRRARSRAGLCGRLGAGVALGALDPLGSVRGAAAGHGPRPAGGRGAAGPGASRATASSASRAARTCPAPSAGRLSSRQARRNAQRDRGRIPARWSSSSALTAGRRAVFGTTGGPGRRPAGGA